MRGFVHEAPVGASVEWYTPKSVFDALGTSFDLDVCSPGLPETWVPASACFTVLDDGLAQPWRGFVWCNPPYGKGIEKWLERMAEHGDGIALVPSRPDTAWFHATVNHASAVLFVRNRIRFHKGDKNEPNSGSPGAGNIFLAYGERGAQVLRESSVKGSLFEFRGVPMGDNSLTSRGKSLHCEGGRGEP